MNNFMKRANKVILDKFWSKENDDTKDYLYVILTRQKVYARLTRKNMFDNRLNCGTFIECVPLNGNQKAIDNYANDLIKEFNLSECSIEELKNIEASTEAEDVKRAFDYAENLIRNS